MIRASNAAELQAATSEARAQGREIVLVPTMGALHAGHLSLVELARAGDPDAPKAEAQPFVVVSVFVNPLQFGVGEDFERYPRTLESDSKLLAGAGADVLFAPDVDVVYPQGQAAATRKHAHRSAEILEGAARPGHFDGMLTVVARLFDLVQPDRAIFGAKDAQQLFLVRQMAATEYPNLKIQAAPTVREASGLALSSRNRFLSSEELRSATALNRTLRQAAVELEAGAPIAEVLKAHEQQLATAAPTAKLEYLQLVSAKDFEPAAQDFKGAAILLIAAKIGETRLIDNLDVLI